MWKNIVKPGSPQMTTWNMLISCWIPTATNKHSEYTILIAFPLQQRFNKHASVLGYTYITCLVNLNKPRCTKSEHLMISNVTVARIHSAVDWALRSGRCTNTEIPILAVMQESWWAPHRGWRMWRRENSLAFARNRIPIPWFSSSCLGDTTELCRFVKRNAGP